MTGARAADSPTVAGQVRGGPGRTDEARSRVARRRRSSSRLGCAAAPAGQPRCRRGRAPGDACRSYGRGRPGRVRHRVTHLLTHRVGDSPGPGSAHGDRARRAAPAGHSRLPADLPGAAAAVPGLPAAAGRAHTA
jgi:hypothetical protein